LKFGTDSVEGTAASDFCENGASTGRHVLLRAIYDGKEVVLKGFIMAEKDQRLALERELAILGRLKSDSIICPRAIVEDSDSFESSYLQKVAVFIEYPYYEGGNLLQWLKVAERKPWELQGIARQLLYGLLYLHDHSVIHRDIKPSNVLMHLDGRVVLADFELSREAKNSEKDEEASTTLCSGTRGFMAPEVESGESAVFASDMYSYGVLLLYMHYPTLATTLVPGNPRLPANCEQELGDLMQSLLMINRSVRPTAASAVLHPYFRSAFVERLLQEGEVVEQDRKLEAVRDLLHRVRSENRTNIERVTVNRENLVATMLSYFQNMPLIKMRSSLKIIFVGEPGVDEGGLLTETFTIFFDAIFSGYGGLFQGANESNKGDGSTDDGAIKVRVWTR
jgi:serine/threonine protein kinase